MNTDRRQFLDDLARRADLAVIAERCGMDVVRDRAGKPRARCPFHDDHRPSLQIYPKEGASDRDHFHCYVCGAHGDAFALVKDLQHIDFWDAVLWVAKECGVVIPRLRGRQSQKPSPPRKLGLQEAAKLYEKLDSDEKAILSSFADRRGFTSKFLMKAEVFAAKGNKIFKMVADDRELLEAMQVAGIIRESEPTRERNASLRLPILPPPRDLYSTDRVVFTIRNREGDVVGFAGRAVGTETPKYLFTRQLPKAKTLYRLDRVVTAIRTKKPIRRPNSEGQENHENAILHLFVVEGLLDALRLESLGLNAVAILGSQLSNEQVSLISELADEADRRHSQLAVHLFLDADIAGRNGMLVAVPRLLKAAADGTAFGVDVIVPHQMATSVKHDPDDLFRSASNVSASMPLLKSWCYSAMDFLLAGGIGCPVETLPTDWPRTEVSRRMFALRFVERQLDVSLWPRVLDRLSPFEQWMQDDPAGELTEYQILLSRFLRTSPANAPKNSEKHGRKPDIHLERTDFGRLLHALQLAQASTQRRELPMDEATWTRLQLAWDVVAPSLKEQLCDATEPPEPMVGVLIPRGDGDFRLKALPACEDLILQQYIMYELLREVQRSRFHDIIPAVRYQSGLRSDSLQTTGPEHLRPANERTVSFAYQIDMDVLEGRTPPRREGMFRPYFDCWTDFISFIDRHVANATYREFHVARLDIRRFYDSLPRHAVHDALFPALRDGLVMLGQDGDSESRTFAPLFRPSINDDPDRRARAIVDWLCDQCFGYRYFDPGTGEINSSQPLERGIPQGPDLSAYLANIAMFPLDHELSRQANALDAIYARYVDDMVVIAPTARDLNRLRAVIEDKLARLGLELSSKTSPLPSMRREEVRAWLTDNRGGLGVSGPFAGPVINEPLTILEPLADAGECDRSKALTLLHDVRMFDPDTSTDVLVRAVKTARSAGNLRFNELVKSARIIWALTVDGEDSKSPTSAMRRQSTDDIAKRFVDLWDKTENSEPTFGPDKLTVITPETQYISNLLASIYGLEEFLRRRDDLNRELSIEKQRTVRRKQEQLAGYVHDGLCRTLIDLQIRRSVGRMLTARFRHMIDLKILAVHVAAGEVDKRSQASIDHLPRLLPPSAAQLPFLFTLAAQRDSPDVIRRLSDSGSSHTCAVRLLLHEAIVRLGITRSPRGPNVDPLERMQQPIDEICKLWDATGNSLPSILRVLQLWLPHSEELPLEIPLCRRAAFALVRIACSPCDVLQRRATLACAILTRDNDTQSRIEVIRSPAGIGMSGMIGIPPKSEDGSQGVVRVDFEDALTCSPATLEWTRSDDSSSVGHVTRFRGKLGTRKVLKPLDGSGTDPNTNGLVSKDDMPLWLACAFESLARCSGREDHAEAAPPTAYNLIGPTLDTTNLRECHWEILSHKVSSENLIGQAFRRSGDRGLIAEAVKEHHANLWRIGTALADWLGLLDDSSRLTDFRATNPIAETEPSHDWAIETLLRVALFRLRGVSLPAKVLPSNAGSELPATITRILDCLKAFPSKATETDRCRRVSMLLGHLAENRAFVERYDTRTRQMDMSAPGAATALLAQISRHQFLADERLAEELPESSAVNGDLPGRRPVRAWRLLADRVRCLAGKSQSAEYDSSAALLPLIVGSELMAVTFQLRMQTLERWVCTNRSQREALLDASTDLSSWDLDGRALLHVNQNRRQASAGKERETVPPLDTSNVHFLFRQLMDATADGAVNTWEALAGVTPLGWCVALASLIGALRAPGRKACLTLPDGFCNDDDQSFRSLSKLLAIEAGDSCDIPWGDLKLVLAGWTTEAIQSVFSFLTRIDTLMGWQVTHHESPHFRIGDSRRSRREVRVSDGDRTISAWQIVTASAQREAANRGAERFQRSGDDLWWYRWSETRQGDRLLSVGTVQPGLASLAGRCEQLSTSHAAVDQSRSQTGRKVDVGYADGPVSRLAEPDSQTDTNPVTSVEDISVREGDNENGFDNLKGVGRLDEFRRIQSESWSRREKLPCHLRIALFQWDVDDSYRHPLFDACMRRQYNDQALQDISESRKKDRHAFWTKDRANGQYDGAVPGLWSCAEHRRRALLKEVLRACRDFKVDVLLLPEYSVRPETVEWLCSKLAEHAPSTWVWAGTYRQPPSSRQTEPIDANWSAVLSLVFSRPGKDDTLQWEVTRRKKKFPAIAMGEQFAPLTGSIKPLVQKSFDLRCKLLELICSEVFIVTSPSNLWSTAHAHRELLRKFGIPSPVNQEKIIADVIREDLGEFAKLTSMCVDPFERRSIVLVPAMTTRAVDYTVLGQASYLAAGLTTVFCNAARGNGYGQSCFIGHDGWDKDDKELIGLPSVGPYHGVLPGIFRPFRSDRGWLGTTEQAVVIADVDPFYSTEGRPRPQMLPAPLQLVAHLPVIESWQYKKRAHGEEHYCRCKVSQKREENRVGELVSGFVKVLSGRSLNATWADSAPEQLGDLLNKLREIADHGDGDWLAKRREAYSSSHSGDSQSWPPPVAVDWLFADLGDPTKVEYPYPSIEVPPYSRGPQ